MTLNNPSRIIAVMLIARGVDYMIACTRVPDVGLTHRPYDFTKKSGNHIGKALVECRI
jgi:hypothetical protein